MALARCKAPSYRTSLNWDIWPLVSHCQGKSKRENSKMVKNNERRLGGGMKGTNRNGRVVWSLEWIGLRGKGHGGGSGGNDLKMNFGE